MTQILVALIVACAIADVLPGLRPGANWNVRGSSYQGIEWLDSQQPKPTQAEIDGAIAECLQVEAERTAQKASARSTIKSTTASTAQKVNALILLLDLDK